MASPDISKTIDAVWKIEAPRLIAALARMTRDVGLAEDLAQDALKELLTVMREDEISTPEHLHLLSEGLAAHHKDPGLKESRSMGDLLTRHLYACLDPGAAATAH